MGRAERTKKQQKEDATSAGAESLFLAKFGLGSLAGQDEGCTEFGGRCDDLGDMWQTHFEGEGRCERFAGAVC